MSSASPYLQEQRHQLRSIMIVLAVMLLFGAGIRFDRAILIDPSRPAGPGSAFAAVVPAPVLFPGTPGQPQGAARAGGAAASETASAAAPGGLPATNDGVGGPVEGASVPADAPAGPVTLASTGAPVELAAGQFGGGSGSLFGIPTGVIFAGPGGGTDPGNGGSTPGIVPEPETWAFMILGVAMIGGTLRRRRNRSGAAGREAVPASA